MDTVKEVQEVQEVHESTAIDCINLTLVSLQSQLDDWLADGNRDRPETEGLDAIAYVIWLFQAWQATDMKLSFDAFVEEEQARE